ncbi:MAG: hypothetical protein JW727_05345 [Candidatus Aenigmarchaeota archaeon]|nr:hypothetical protein [Candidatus Aenigmarchaeota archaeon]
MDLKDIKPIPIDKVAKGLSLSDRLRYGLIYVRLSGENVREMKIILKTEARKIMNELGEPKLSIFRDMEAYLDKYIDGLSKKDTFKIYMAYLEAKEAIGVAQENYAKFEFIIKLYQTYRKKGWPKLPRKVEAIKKKAVKQTKKIKKVVKKARKKKR